MSLDALIELTGSKEAACSINRPMPIITWSWIYFNIYNIYNYIV
jgi:hypothetical protein